MSSMARRPPRLLRWAGLPAAAMAGLAAVYAARHSTAVFLIFFGVGALWLAAAAALAAGRLRDLLILAASTAIALAAIEGAGLVVDRNHPRAENFGRYTQDYIGFNPVLGAAPARAGVFDSRKIDVDSGRIIYDVSYTIDDSLLRRTVSPPTGGLLAFFGDSFTFGEGVGDAETLPQRTVELAGGRLRALNFGFHGYGPQQFLRAMETGLFDGLLKPDLRLVVFQTAPWHAERTSCTADFVADAPRYRLDDGVPVFDGACAGGIWKLVHHQFEKSAAFRVFLQPALASGIGRADVELYVAVVARAVALARERYGAPTLILYLAYDDAYLKSSGFSNEDIVTRLRAAGADVVDATLAAPDGTPLKRYDRPSPYIIAGDGHPTALAQDERAQILVRHLRSTMPDLLAP